MPITQTLTTDESHLAQSENEALTRPRLISDYLVRGVRYFIIAIDIHLDANKLESSLLAFLNDLDIQSFEKIDDFSLNNSFCVVVEVKPIETTSRANIAEILTAREMQVVSHIAQGHPNKKIAKLLHISEWTVATHIRRIFAKLNVDSRAALVFRCADWIRKTGKVEI